MKPDPGQPVSPPIRQRLLTAAPGLGLALLVALVATGLGRLVPLVGAPVFGLVLGVIVGTAVPTLRTPYWSPGYAVAGRQLLQLSIVLLGCGLSLGQVFTVGAESLPVMLGTLAVALVGGLLLGRLLGIDRDTTTLISIGTGICGASAIAATSAVIKPKQNAIAYAIGTIFAFNIAAVLIFPPLGRMLGLSPESFGLWSGTAVNDTSSVVATAYAFDLAAGPHAVVVKLARSLMIIPIVLALSLLATRRNRDGGRVSPLRLVPPFLIGFLVTAGLQTLGLIPAAWQPVLSAAAIFLITAALTGIGLSLRISELRRSGPRPLLLGGTLWLLVAASSLGLQAITGTL